MQPSQSFPAAGDLVCVRRQRWRVLDAHGDGDLRLLTLAGTGVSNGGLIRRFITPFDVVYRIEQSEGRPQRCSRGRWRATLRHLIGSSAPPGSLRALPGASIDLLPHQLAPALAVVRGLFTRVLLADDVGLGKTIEAGLILAELLARGAVTRALLLAPSGLREQWRSELETRFGIVATVCDAASLRAITAEFGPSVNPWLACDVAVASIDLVKRPEHLARILECGWDLLIVDEAHNVVGDSDRRAAVASVAGRVPYVVLVTATPHNGSRSAFAALCAVGAVGADDDALGVFRRTRGDVHLGVERRAHRLLVRPTAAERRMHQVLATFTRAIAREHAESRRDVWLALAVMNKRALSSATALQRTVSRRLASLRAAAGERGEAAEWTATVRWPGGAADPACGAGPSRPAVQQLLPLGDPDGELDGADDVPGWTGGPVLADVAHERRMLASLERAASEAALAGESKVNAIRRWLDRADEPAIVFSEYRDTLQHLASHLQRPTLQLHGGMTARERVAVLEEFASDSRAGGDGPRGAERHRAAILLATDAAGEGLNLHERCRVVINLELPWNPVRLEQRIGRVDRIGQQRRVHAIALIAKGTPEERILERLRLRVARARHDLRGADPLELVTEAEIERLVLAPAMSDPHARVDPVPSLCSLALSAESASEVERARVHRRIRSWSPRPAAVDSTLISRARNPRTRIGLGGSSLLVAEAVLEDGAGRIVERAILPFRIRGCLDPSTLVSALAGSGSAIFACPGVDAWRATATALWQALTAARLRRERAIVTSLARDGPPATVQPGLFDRRAERAMAVARAAYAAALDAATRRADASALAAERCSVRVSIRLVLRGAP